MSPVLKKSFFQRNAFVVARNLLGKYLVRKYRGKTTRYIITEIEVYEGFDDKASHAHRGKTARTEIMFGPGGHWYVYFIYGMYYMLNVVVGKKDYPAAILIRGVMSLDGKHINGPGKLTRELHIDKRLNTQYISPESGLWIEESNIKVPKKHIYATPRIGVQYSGELWAQKPYRFVFKMLG
jgi:DNA-3-methyladenine glycosylase